MRLIDADLLEKAGLMLMKLSDKQEKLLTKFEWKDVPTAYDVEKVVEELEEFANLAEDRWVNGTSTHAYQEHKCWVKAIEIVRKGKVE